MEIMRLQRAEGNAWYNMLTCLPLLVVAFVVSMFVGLRFPVAQDIILGLMLVLLGVFYLWLIGVLPQGRWYLEFTEEGVIYKAFLIRNVYRWEYIQRIYGRKTDGHTGKFNDVPVVQTPSDEVKFFLHDFDISSKDRTRNFIGGLVETCKQRNLSAIQDDDPYLGLVSSVFYDEEG